MKLFVYGGSGSGKSAYAERRAAGLNENRIYLATMKESCEEDGKRIKKHRDMRKDYSFLTIEQCTDINRAIEIFHDGVILLECVSNLVANEMFKDGIIIPGDDVVVKVLSDLRCLMSKCKDIVIVSNNIFEDGICYDESVGAYMKALGRINAELISMSDEAVEVVVGIAMNIK